MWGSGRFMWLENKPPNMIHLKPNVRKPVIDVKGEKGI